MNPAEVIATASFVVAFLSFVVAVIAIRRDRAVLRVRVQAGTGTSYLVLDNIGLRPVRIVKVVRRRHRALPFGQVEDLAPLVGTETGRALLPLVLPPAGTEVVALRTDVSGSGYLLLEDAAGHRHGVGP